MELNEILHFMRHHPWNWYYVYDHEYSCENLTPQEREASWEKYRVRYEKLDEIGSHICSVLMPPKWWCGIEQYDFSLIDKYMDALLKDYPHRYFVPRIKLEPPLDWQKAHPEELCVYWNGPTTAEEIRSMVGTSYQDMAGYGTRKQPYPDERIAQQSFSSKLWVEDACKALTVLIRHMEARYGSRIIGYMPAFGNCGECMWWGDWRWQGDPRKGDFGLSHKKHFYDWAVKKYGSLAALRSAWNLPDLTEENLPIPTPPERWSINGKDLRGVMLGDDRRQVDCNEFHSDACFDAIEAFGKTVKEVTGKAAGSFYGYFQDPTGGYAGHMAIRRALTTPYVDFYSSPKGYHYCLAGEPGSSQAPGQSFARKKLWIEENDCRSHHSNDKHRKAANFAETQNVFWREIYRALTFKQGFWWMDIGGLRDDWYADEDMVKMFKAQADFYKKWSPMPRKDVAEVLFVEDEASNLHTTYLMGPQLNLRLRLERELRHCGAPVDHLRVADLLEYDLSRYKFIVFCHAFVMPKELWQTIRSRMRPDVHVLWNYAAAILDPEFSRENQKTVTGFYTEETPDRLHHNDLYRHIHWHSNKPTFRDYPLVSIVQEDGQEVLQASPDGHILTARVRQGQGASIFAADFTLRTPLLRKLLADAGVNIYCPEYCSVLADEKLLGFFPHFDVTFPYTFEGKWRNVMTGELVEGQQTLLLREKEFAIFEKT